MLEYTTKYPQLVDANVCDKTLEYYSADNKTVTHTEKWKDVYVEYKFNSLGYRSVEPNTLSKDYIWCTGCSYTEGVGLILAQTWPDRLAKYIETDYYNAGKGGSGPDVMTLNAQLWKQHNLPKPALVVAEWPQLHRRMSATDNGTSIEVNVVNDWWEKEYITDMGLQRLNAVSWYCAFNDVWASQGVPVINFQWEVYPWFESLTPKMYCITVKEPYTEQERDNRYQARDNMHDGPEFHRYTALELLKIYNKEQIND